jgi:hypothetical protein
VDPVPDPLLLRKSGSTGNRTLDLYPGTLDETTEAVILLLTMIITIIVIITISWGRKLLEKPTAIQLVKKCQVF